VFVCLNGVCPGQKTIAYYKVCQIPVNYEIIMFYNTGPCPICCCTTQGAKVIEQHVLDTNAGKQQF
jgi:hypothetical protein